MKKIIIGISGASCSGKTWISQNFVRSRPDDITVFYLDNYYKEMFFVNCLEYRHDNPKSIDYASAFEDLCSLRDGIDTFIPFYDYVTHSVTRRELVKPANIIIVDGIFSFYNNKLCDLFDIKLWIDSDLSVLLERRISRDVSERGRDYHEVIDRVEKNVIPSYNKFILDLRRKSDIIYDNTKIESNPIIVEIILRYADYLISKSNSLSNQ